jgi:hypothetical protein
LVINHVDPCRVGWEGQEETLKHCWCQTWDCCIPTVAVLFVLADFDGGGGGLNRRFNSWK